MDLTYHTVYQPKHLGQELGQQFARPLKVLQRVSKGTYKLDSPYTQDIPGDPASQLEPSMGILADKGLIMKTFRM
jgi:hypothetical protein